MTSAISIPIPQKEAEASATTAVASPSVDNQQSTPELAKEIAAGVFDVIDGVWRVYKAVKVLRGRF